MNAVTRLDALARSNPEWTAWLHVLREVVAELSAPAWDAHPPQTVPAGDLAPLLAGAGLRPDGDAVAGLLDRLAGVARDQGLQALAGERRQQAWLPGDALAVFLAALEEDEPALDRQAARAGAAPDGWRTLARLLPMPYLHACARRWAAQRPRPPWSQGYCPVCGAWPAFAEVLGVDRARQLRCGRCGAGWPAPALACTYCASTDHETLGTLVVEGRASTFSVDVCRGCSGYLKSCTTLQATPPDAVFVADLASVEFDLAAVDRGFSRPPGQAVALHAFIASDAVLARPEPGRF
jgi:FdhE protein